MAPERTHATPTLRLSVPAGWTTTENPARGHLRAAPPPTTPGDPTHIVVVTVVDALATGDLDAYAATQLRDLARTLDDLVVLSVHADPDDPAGPVVDLLVAHEVLGHDVTSVQRHVVGRSGTVVIASASTDDLQWPHQAGTLTGAVRSLQVGW